MEHDSSDKASFTSINRKESETNDILRKNKRLIKLIMLIISISILSSCLLVGGYFSVEILSWSIFGGEREKISRKVRNLDEGKSH